MHNRTSSNHFFCCLVRVLGEVVVEQLAKLVDLILEAGRRRPAVLGVEQLGPAGVSVVKMSFGASLPQQVFYHIEVVSHNSFSN